MSSSDLPRVALTVDLDFYCREDPHWDWGHNEDNPLFAKFIWQVRYAQLELYKETELSPAARLLHEKKFAAESKKAMLAKIARESRKYDR